MFFKYPNISEVKHQTFQQRYIYININNLNKYNNKEKC